MVVVGEIFLGAFLQVLFQKLMSEELINFVRGESVHKKLEDWSKTLRMVQAVLSDAEEKQLSSEAVKLWLGDLRDLAYDVEDVLDKFFTELLRRKIEKLHQGQASSSKLWNFIPTCCTSFGYFMVDIDLEINEITRRLEDISRREEKLGLNKIERSVTEWKRPPCSSLPVSPVVGRDESKKEIVELLLRDNQSVENFDVVGMVGMPGVGKTTLARLVFIDDAMKHFDIKVWVCVSDDFDYVRLTKAILNSIGSESKNFDEFSKIQDCLGKVLAGKKFLIVMDDVWNRKYELWLALQSPFRAGAPGSKILVTTRNEDVAKLMGAVECYNLECISEDDCWTVFVQHFSNRKISEPSKLESQRENVVSKCNGLPLAAQTLGGLLRCKEIDEWKDVLENKLWTQPEHSNILSLLKLSYHNLPPHLKRCFAYCSILPEDYEFEEKQLILLWMAEGLLQNPEGGRQMEDLGREYFRELLSRSFFQKSKKDESKYVMHDLFNNFARLVAGEIGFRLEDKLDDDKQCRIFRKVRHSAYFSAEFEGMHRLEVFSKLEHLRTFLPLSHSYDERRFLSSNFTLQVLPKLQYLKVLSLKGYCIRKLPDSVGELKLLRYLDLSYTYVTSLPESISHLYNLQTLLLEGCVYLNALPTGLKNLINLRHLIYSNIWHLKWSSHSFDQEDSDSPNRGPLKGMPSNMGKLTNLQTLSYFVVGKESSSSGVGELGPLLHLCGTLNISGLENVKRAKDAVMANLAGKDGIDVLLLEWNAGEIVDPDIFESLQPPRMLKELTVKSYGGVRFPSWMGNLAIFSKMVVMRLEDCKGCRLLPPLGQLVPLKKLIIEGMSGVESIGMEFYGEGCLKPFPSLETLSFENMENWKDWFPFETNNGMEGFPQLKELSLRSCPKLNGKLPESLPSLETLSFENMENWEHWFQLEPKAGIEGLPQLKELSLRSCPKLNGKLPESLPSLETLVVDGCEQLVVSIPAEGLTRLKDLKVSGCKEMSSVWQDELRQLTSLEHLQIDDTSLQHPRQVELCLPTKVQTLQLRYCNNLVKVPEGLDLTLLQELHINHCPSLTCFPESGLPSSLRVLRIEECKNLISLVRDDEYSSSNCTPPPNSNSICLEQLFISGCPSLKSISSANGSLPASFKNLHIECCDALQCLSTGKLPGTLRNVEIGWCQSLICLSSEGELPEALESLYILSCGMLKSLKLSDAGLPKELKRLGIASCGQLESIVDRFDGYTCLESVFICTCEKLRSLPEGLHHLINLTRLRIESCENLVSFPEGGLPTSNLISLQELGISGLTRPLEEGGFPPNLTELTIWNLEVSKPLFQSGLLHRLTSLRRLHLKGNATDMASFPPEDKQEGRMMMMLPNSLISLVIWNFENLDRLSSGFQCLTSLQYLSIYNCEKLKSLPGGLPLSLLKLEIDNCPLLKKRCTRDEGPLWPHIAHIPCVEFD